MIYLMNVCPDAIPQRVDNRNFGFLTQITH